MSFQGEIFKNNGVFSDCAEFDEAESYVEWIIFENIIYLELINRGYNVSIGKVGEHEVDFVAKKTDEIIYYQVAQSLIDKSTYEREMKPLRLIKDNYPKYVLSMDNVLSGNDEGIKHMNIIDFLLDEQYDNINNKHSNI